MPITVSLGGVRNSLPNYLTKYGTSKVDSSFCRALNPYFPSTGAFSLSALIYNDAGLEVTYPLVAVRVLGETITFQTTKTGPYASITFTFWCFLNTTTYDANEAPVSIDDGTHAYVIDLESNTAASLPSFWGTRGGVSYSGIWPSNQWLFVTFTYNNTTMTSSVYATSGTTPLCTATSPTFATTDLGNPTTTFGYIPRYPGHAQAYYMYVYDYRQYNGALSSAELLTLRNTGVISGKTPVSMIVHDGGVMAEKRASGGQTVNVIGTGHTYKFFKQVTIDGN